MKHSSRKPVAMVVCQNVSNVTDIDSHGFYYPEPCECVMLMAHARAVSWKCPKCKQSDKEMWKPCSVEALRMTKELNMLTETIEEAAI